ncbi:MAG: fatty acid desaturase [bacterium]
MHFLSGILEPPSYGFSREGKFYVPTRREIFAEFFSRINFFQSKKNWLAFWSWFSTLILAIPLSIFFLRYFSWPLLFLGLFYSMVVLGTFGTVYYHRYSTHKAYTFKNKFWRFICRNLVIKLIPEELYVVSHHVHHHLPELPGDPYNVHGGWLYCFLADANHQPIAKNLSEKSYEQLTKLLQHTGVNLNDYGQYKKWGSLCHPGFTLFHYFFNWLFWFAVFYFVGGFALATAIFGLAGVWAVGVRTFNFDGHGGGKDKRVSGIDFNRKDLSINQVWPGYVAGEWHNNHHLYPNGARSGFLPYQLDLAWLFIRFYSSIGGIDSYRDYKEDFFRDHYRPYLSEKEKGSETEADRNFYPPREKRVALPE